MKRSSVLCIIVLSVLCRAVFASEEIDRSQPRCGIENCHGLDIVCGENIPEACTMIYKFGDRCRQYARCEIMDGECVLVESEEFKECKACVQKCQETFQDDMMIKGFECESRCGRPKENPNED